jgi:hypothetical protein
MYPELIRQRGVGARCRFFCGSRDPRRRQHAGQLVSGQPLIFHQSLDAGQNVAYERQSRQFCSDGRHLRLGQMSQEAWKSIRHAGGKSGWAGANGRKHAKTAVPDRQPELLELFGSVRQTRNVRVSKKGGKSGDNNPITQRIIAPHQSGESPSN